MQLSSKFATIQNASFTDHGDGEDDGVAGLEGVDAGVTVDGGVPAGVPDSTVGSGVPVSLAVPD